MQQVLVEDLGLVQQRLDPSPPLQRDQNPNVVAGRREEGELSVSLVEHLFKDPPELRVGRLGDLVDLGDREARSKGLLYEVDRQHMPVLKGKEPLVPVPMDLVAILVCELDDPAQFVDLHREIA